MVKAFRADELYRILDSARQGDAEARGTLLEMYRQYLRLLARLRFDPSLQGKLSASDLVQETFVQANRAFAQFKGTTESELTAWLRAILVSQVADQVRRYATGKRNVGLEKRIEVDLNLSRFEGKAYNDCLWPARRAHSPGAAEWHQQSFRIRGRVAGVRLPE